MTGSPLAPVCSVPACKEVSCGRFLGLSQLCPAHRAKANRRAMINVLVIGPLLALGSVPVLWGSEGGSERRVYGLLLLAAGVLVTGSAAGFRLGVPADEPE